MRDRARVSRATNRCAEINTRPAVYASAAPAIEIARKIEKYDVYWFEEPVNPDDYEGHRLVSQASSIPVATGENEYTRYGFRDLIEKRCCDIIQPDGLIMGGPTEFMKVAAMAQEAASRI